MERSHGSSIEGYLEALAEIEATCEDIVILESQKAVEGSDILRPRRISAGLSEQNMILNASGLALSGKRVFVHAPFSPLFVARTYELIRASVAIPNLKVMLSSVQDGAELDRDGASRQMNEDLALMRVLPNIAVLAPSDRTSAYRLTRSLLTREGPIYMRLSHTSASPIYNESDADFHVGAARLLAEGDGVTICACGIMVREALKASAILSQQGISAEIIDCYSIKPLPEQALLASVRRTGCCVVAEKHNRIGGLFGAVAECLCRNYSVPVRYVAIEDDFGQSGTPEELQEYYGLTHREIVDNVVQVWAMRRR